MIDNNLQTKKIALFTETKVGYGGGEKIIVRVHDYLNKQKLGSIIVENTNFKYKNKDSDNIISILDKNLLDVKYKRYGFPKFLYQDIPPLNYFLNNDFSVSLILLRRVPSRKILKTMYLSNAKIIFCLHGIALEKIRITHPLIMLHQVITRIKLKQLSHYTNNHLFIQTLLPSVSNKLLNYGADSKNIFTIGNDVPINTFNIRQNDDIFSVVFIGRIENLQKGIDRLRKVIYKTYKLDKRIKFNIVGSGKDVKKLSNLPDNAKFYNFLSETEKVKIIEKSNIGVITSNLEPFPLVALELLSAGLPVVTTPASGPSYIISKDVIFGNISSFKSNDIVNSIYKYFQIWTANKNEYFKLKEEIAKKYRKSFNNSMLDSYFKMITSIINRK